MNNSHLLERWIGTDLQFTVLLLYLTILLRRNTYKRLIGVSPLKNRVKKLQTPVNKIISTVNFILLNPLCPTCCKSSSGFRYPQSDHSTISATNHHTK